MIRPDDIEWRVHEENPNGLWDAYAHSNEDDALADADYIRRARPGRRVIVYKIVPVLVKAWAADEIHPRAVGK